VIPFLQPSPSDPFSPGKVFTFLRVTIGPLEVIGPFAKMTAGWDRGLKAPAPVPGDHDGGDRRVRCRDGQVALGVQAVVEALPPLRVPALTAG
jgi:hypothetical protein